MVLDLIKELFKPASDLIDSLHTSEEEKLDAKRRIIDSQTGLALQMLEYEAKLVEQQHATIMAEANGQSWLQRNWRPLTMLTFLILVVLDSFGILTNRLAPEAWLLLQIGLGGYVAGRSIEKVMPSIQKIVGDKS